MSDLKQQLYQASLAQITARIQAVEEAMQAVQADAAEETKSSAGDKYETGRAMIHLEMEKLSSQLEEFIKSKKTLEQIDLQKRSDTVQQGAVILTDDSHYFLSVSLGQLRVGDKSFFCISPASPVGQALLGKKKGDVVSFRNQRIVLREVL
ncbi:GreA/GreB family elongation factor [Pseudochryseolinea flava]|uniref:3-oxoacyl-ACP synthase n=1 Tax=Pseudochryseolinea flava TaxID=2059302 RepID=A0A364Y3B8_9BACT|nr:GreA/GreB family elongation factor [Pseudochryseolinea flava]RAW01403.1 3-oxoacyl-ACP synthase [Pseudochryseolinea flava]